jgi:hypothetical protein
MDIIAAILPKFYFGGGDFIYVYFSKTKKRETSYNGNGGERGDLVFRRRCGAIFLIVTEVRPRRITINCPPLSALDNSTASGAGENIRE